jgi:hypothetical protein
MDSTGHVQGYPYKLMSSDEALKHLKQMVPQKRPRSLSPLSAPTKQQQFAHISPHASPPPPSKLPSASLSLKLKNPSYDYSRMSPRSAEYYQNYALTYRIPLPASPNTPGRKGASQREVDAAIERFIKPLVEEDPKWMKFMESKARPPTVSEVLQQFLFVQGKVDEVCGTHTPIHWDGAPKFEIQKVSHPLVIFTVRCLILFCQEHVWELLNLEPEFGADCEETLSLLTLYGPDGQRYEDSRVIDMIHDTSTPVGKPYKRFLRLLRQIDQDWLKDNPSDAESDRSLGSATGGTREEGRKDTDVSVHERTE